MIARGVTRFGIVDHQAAELGQKAGLGLDEIRAQSRHSSIATPMLYVDEHDRQRTQQTLADLVASTVSGS